MNETLQFFKGDVPISGGGGESWGQDGFTYAWTSFKHFKIYRVELCYELWNGKIDFPISLNPFESFLLKCIRSFNSAIQNRGTGLHNYV